MMCPCIVYVQMSTIGQRSLFLFSVKIGRFVTSLLPSQLSLGTFRFYEEDDNEYEI